MKRLVPHIVLALAIICGLCATPHAIAKFASESLSPKERIEVFETIWKTINEDYYDPEFHGIDWALVRERISHGLRRRRTMTSSMPSSNKCSWSCRIFTPPLSPPASSRAPVEFLS